MRIPEWIFAIGLLIALLVSFGIFGYLLGYLLDSFGESKRLKHFEEDLVLAVKATQPSWDQVLEIAATRSISTFQVYKILRRLMREILTGRSTDLLDYRHIIETYLSRLKEAEPFEGLPNEIRIHLERIREQVPNAPLMLQPLTSQIRELVSINEKEKRYQKYYTTGGFAVGVIGLFFAAFAYFHPYLSDSTYTSGNKIASCDKAACLSADGHASITPNTK